MVTNKEDVSPEIEKFVAEDGLPKFLHKSRHEMKV